MKELLIGDIHFGTKTNSTIWLDIHLNFFRKFLFKILKEEHFDRIVFLGDIFDIRYAINQQIGIEAKNIIRELCDIFQYPYEIIFVAGNHDYYSPLEEFVDYNAYELVFGPEFKKCYPNVRFVNKDPYYDGNGGLFLPWYWTENPDHFDDLLYQYKFGSEVKAIYCPLNFGDVNQERYLYVLEDFKITRKITNTITPLFKRFYNEDIFTITEDDIDNSYVQLCVSSNNINKAKYIEQIKYLKNSYTSSNISLRVVDDFDTVTSTPIAEGFNTNITEYIENNIPEHLDVKYQYVKDKLSKDL